MPTGSLSRVGNNSLASEFLGCEPEMKFADGLHRTIDWCFPSTDPDRAQSILDRMLTERQ